MCSCPTLDTKEELTGGYRGFCETVLMASTLNRYSESYQTLFSRKHILYFQIHHAQHLTETSPTELDVIPYLLWKPTRLNNSKAAGTDAIQPEIWQHGDHVIHNTSSSWCVVGRKAHYHRR